MNLKQQKHLSTMNAKKHEIFKLLGVLLGAMSCALLFALFMLYHYGSSGHYSLQNILISPEIVQKLAFNESNSLNLKAAHFIFKGMEFIYYDSEKRSEVHEKVKASQYEDIYKLLKDDKNLLKVSTEIDTFFYNKAPARVVILVKQEGKSELDQELETFQEVQFGYHSSFYRVRIRAQEGKNDAWIYFKHPDVYNKVLEIFTHDDRR